jgi:hypothetical protein
MCGMSRKTTKPIRPLHLLPVPDKQCDSVAINFISLLSLDEGFDSIITLTDHLGSDIWAIPCRTTLTAEELTELFFINWY